MKLAVIGSGPLALFCAQHFHQLGGEVVLFQCKPLGGKARFYKSIAPDLNVQIKGETKTLETFWQEDLIPLIQDIEFNGLSKVGEVLRVHKRFLNPKEIIDSRSRLYDLFRVVFSVNPKDSILQQVQENPEIFKQLGEQVMDSLHLPVESFEDFDLVIEATGEGESPLPMGPGRAEALNENNLKTHAAFYYEEEIFRKLDLSGKKHIVIIGETHLTALAFLKCQDWLWQSHDHSLTWVTSYAENQAPIASWAKEMLTSALTRSNENFQAAKAQFVEEMRGWRDLEDHLKAKIAKPLEPEAKIKIYRGYEVTAVDKLLDREGVFATIESPDFRTYAKTAHDLKTLAADALLVTKGKKEESVIARGLDSNEPGFYRLNAQSVDEGLLQIEEIEKKIMNFFSRVDS